MWGQRFERIETLAGLGVLRENNGVAIADYDKDLDMDIFIVAKAKDESGIEKSHSRLFQNNNDGSFTDVTARSNLVNLFPIDEVGDAFDGLDGFKFAASWGDYDNDGFPDIFFTHTFKVQLFHNQGDGTFQEVTETAGFERINGCRNTGATWTDYNNDGFLDILINDWGACDGNSLYKNNGNGTFQDVTLEMGIATGESLASYTMLPFDFNNDGWKDFYISNDFFQANSLFVNQNGEGSSEQAAIYGVNSKIEDMGITVSDFDNDGNFDFFVTGISENSLLKNNGNNNFTEVSAANNVSDTGWAWGCRFADFDLDGDEDLFVVNGFKLTTAQPNTYYRNLYREGQNTFADISGHTNLGDVTRSMEAQDFDYDNDGDLDLFVTNSYGASFLYENKILDSRDTTDLKWFKVSLEGTISNRDAYGTKVSITTSDGAYIRYYSGVGFLSQSLKPVHFGLDETAQIDEVKIFWPSGMIESYQNLTANIHIKAIEGQGYQILDIAPSEKIYGCTDSKSCTYNPSATASDNSCEYIESKEIIGETRTGLNRVESYTYASNPDSQLVWTVEGGEILKGQGSKTITVKWGFSSGKVTLLETNDHCEGSLVELNVEVSINDMPENVSIARIWNEALLEAIRNDYARPTVHARNLFHTAIALYDSWAIYDDEARPYLTGNMVQGYQSNLEEFIPTEGIEESRQKAMSYAAYRLLSHRFRNSPGAEQSMERFDLIMIQSGYDASYTDTSYQSGNAAALGNYIGQNIINYGRSDGSRESSDYDNGFYEPINPPLILDLSGEPSGIIDPNRWQPLSFNTFIDQSGNTVSGATPYFLGSEWGIVFPFALSTDDRSILQRNGRNYTIYHDPGPPPQLSTTLKNTSSEEYKWNFALVSLWSSHLDPDDGVLWDISPKSIGNIDIGLFPSSFSRYSDFYKGIEGGDIGTGHDVNPKTGLAYETQLVPRGDYARVLAEFWADGPDSETPPGHWFTILNYVSDHPLFEKKFNGQGEVVTPLEWDVKSYFILSGAMHDSAISAWGIKGWYDYIRPISAIRYMCGLGQSTDPNLANYNIGGVPLVDGFIEVVEKGDILSGLNDGNIGKIKVKAWRGHDFIDNADIDVAGVGWILSENWWPYQRPSFVTPPFAGYVSGHSTFSRAAAEVLTLITGDEFFPGGMGEFVAKKDEFLAFEKGPSVDVTLQWATYRDASDQTSLSRIWGGIHPPADDIIGRLIGEQVGIDAFNFAVPYFSSNDTSESATNIVVYPNPVITKEIYITNIESKDSIYLFDMQGRSIQGLSKEFNESNGATLLKLPNSIALGVYVLRINGSSKLVIVGG